MNSRDELQSNVQVVVPCCVVAVGGTGRVILGHLKANLRQAFGGAIPEIYQFLYIDTAPLENGPSQEPIEPGEYEGIGGVNPAEVAANIAKYPSIAAWLTHRRPGINMSHRGAGTRRDIGRMCLFMNIERVDTTLRMKLANMRRIGAVEALRLNGYQVGHHPQVYVLGSTAGGTGAGCFLDLGYLVRYRAPDCGLTSVLCLADVYEPVLRGGPRLLWHAQANCAVAIKETNYCFSHMQWNVDYGLYTVESHSAPFDTTYLASLQSSRGRRLSHTEDVYKMIGRHVALQISPGLGTKLQEDLANVKGVIDDAGPFEGHPRAYSAMVVAELRYPAQDIVEYCQFLLSRALIRTGALRSSPLSVEQIDLPAALNPEHLRQRLQPDWHPAVSNAQTRAISRAERAADVHHTLDGQLEELNEGLKIAQTTITERCTQLLDLANATVERAAWQEVKVSGLPAGRAFIQGVSLRVTEVTHLIEREIEECAARLRAGEDRLRECRQEIDRLGHKSRLSWLRGKLGETGQRASRIQIENFEDQLELAILRGIQDLLKQVKDHAGQGRARQRSLREWDEALDTGTSRMQSLADEAQSDAEKKLAEKSRDTFELVTDVVGADYIRAFYHRSGQPERAETLYVEFTAAFGGLREYLDATSDQFKRRLRDFTRRPFESLTEGVRLLDLLKEPQFKGQIRLDLLLERAADVFLRYKPHQGFDESDIVRTFRIGIDRPDPDAMAELITPVLNKHRTCSLAFTGDPHRIIVDSTAHGFPPNVLADLDNYGARAREHEQSGAAPLDIGVLPEPASSQEPARQNGRKAVTNGALPVLVRKP